MEGLIYCVILVGGLIFFFISMDKAAEERTKKRETVFGYAEQKDNGAHYERLAESRWGAFLNESADLAPYSSKYKKATAFRHAWRRANVLKDIYQSSRDLENMLVHQAFISLAEFFLAGTFFAAFFLLPGFLVRQLSLAIMVSEYYIFMIESYFKTIFSSLIRSINL